MLNEVLSKRIKLVELKLLYDMKKPLGKPIRKMLVDAVRSIRAEVKSSGMDWLAHKAIKFKDTGSWYRSKVNELERATFKRGKRL